MQITKRTSIMILSLTSLVFGVAELQASKRAAYTGTVRWGSRYDVHSLDPISAENPAEVELVMLVFDRLVKTDRVGGPRPSLCSSWLPNYDSTNWYFTLQKGVRFHDGSALKAKDIKYSLERLIKSGHTWVSKFLANTISGAAEFAQGEEAEISGILVSNSYTLTIVTKTPQPNFPDVLALAQCSIVKPSKSKENNQPDKPTSKSISPLRSIVGSGPFFIAQHAKNKIILHAFDAYHGGPPFLNKIEVDYKVSSKQQLVLFRLGKLDLIEVALPEKTLLEKDNTGTVFMNPKSFTVLLGSNPRSPVFKKPHVREAVDKVIDRDIILKVLLKGEGRSAHGYFPPEIAEFANLRDKRTRKLEAAKKAMPREQTTSPEQALSFIIRSSDEFAINIVQRIAVNLRDLGLKSQIETVPDEAFAARFSKGKYDLFLDSFPINSAAVELELYSFLAKYSSVITPESLERATSYVNLAKTSSNNDERLKQLYLAEREILEDYTLVPLFHTNSSTLVVDDIGGIWFDPQGTIHLEDAWQK